MTSTVARSGRGQQSRPRGHDADGTARDVADVVSDPDQVFEALAREGCRDVLRAIGDETLTAAEIGERVDAPMSSIYRHLDTMRGAGLLAEAIRVDPHSRNQHEYTRDVSEVLVDLREDGQVRLR